MREFKSIDWFVVRGKRVVTVALDREEERDHLHERLSVDQVLIDGVERKVIGVESWAITSLRAGTVVGLMLDDVTAPSATEDCK